ncbi:hypothetical protein THF1D04_40172 [Vibrio owensii]|uniref:Uncharacterized protein n=1 Tax=Vibrio owensii TaxID=696485 RepID=A0AAU9Q8D5_9VIBR|nr:hypothetical protein THF1D04_40172 [Vibrio owensii]
MNINIIARLTIKIQYVELVNITKTYNIDLLLLWLTKETKKNNDAITPSISTGTVPNDLIKPNVIIYNSIMIF